MWVWFHSGSGRRAFWSGISQYCSDYLSLVQLKSHLTGLLVSAIISGALEIQGWLWLHQCSRVTQGLVGMIGTWAGLCSVKLWFDERNLCWTQWEQILSTFTIRESFQGEINQVWGSRTWKAYLMRESMSQGLSFRMGDKLQKRIGFQKSGTKWAKTRGGGAWRACLPCLELFLKLREKI